MLRLWKNQFGFMHGQSTTKAIHLLQRLIERLKVSERDLYMVFIDLEKAYDRVSRDVLWWALNKKTVSLKYVSIIRNIYERVVTNVDT